MSDGVLSRFMTRISKQNVEALRTSLLGLAVILMSSVAGLWYEVSAPAAETPRALSLSIVTGSRAPDSMSSLAHLIVRDWSSSANLKRFRTAEEEEKNLHELLAVQISFDQRDYAWARLIGDVSNADALFAYYHDVDGGWILVPGTGPIGLSRPTTMPAGRLLSADAILTWRGKPQLIETNLKNLLRASCSKPPRLSGSFATDGRQSIQCTMPGVKGRSVTISIFANSTTHQKYLNSVLRPSREAAMLNLGKPYGLVNSFGWTAIAPKISACGVQATLGGEIVWPTTQREEREVQGPFDKGCLG
jgi:hypothetical protein